MGSMEFSAQYQQSPIPAGGNLIRWSWFRFFDTAPRAQCGDRIIVSWDTAISSNQLADYSVCAVLLVRGQTMFLLEIIRERVEYPELRRIVISSHHRWRSIGVPTSLLIENKGSGQSLIQDLRQQDIHAIGITPDGDKVMRMAAQTACIEAGALHVPRQAPWLDEFKSEILGFPGSKHDDQIDALSQALQRAYAPAPPSAIVGYYNIVR